MGSTGQSTNNTADPAFLAVSARDDTMRNQNNMML